MSKIFIESRPAPEKPSPYDHLYLVYQNNLGEEFVIRGGPTGNILMLGNLIVEVNKPINSSEDARGSDTAQQRGHWG